MRIIVWMASEGHAKEGSKEASEAKVIPCWGKTEEELIEKINKWAGSQLGLHHLAYTTWSFQGPKGKSYEDFEREMWPELEAKLNQGYLQ